MLVSVYCEYANFMKQSRNCVTCRCLSVNWNINLNLKMKFAQIGINTIAHTLHFTTLNLIGHSHSSKKGTKTSLQLTRPLQLPVQQSCSISTGSQNHKGQGASQTRRTHQLIVPLALALSVLFLVFWGEYVFEKESHKS